MEARFDPNQPLVTQAYEAIRPELEAMRPEELEPIRYDIMQSMFTALGTVPKLRTLRDQARARFGEEAVRFIDRLEIDARAVGKAHALHLLAVHGTDLEEIVGRLTQTRTVLLLEVQALVAVGALPPVVVAELVGGTSYRGLCLDVLQLTSALRGAWSDVESKTGVTMLEVDQAEAMANQLSTLLGENEQGTIASPTSDMRRRAYTRFVRTYGEVRRIATFFRWEAGDVDEMVPPLGANRRSSGNHDDADAEPAVALPDAHVPPVVPVAPTA